MIKTIKAKDFLSLQWGSFKIPMFADIETDGLYTNCSLIQLRQGGQSFNVAIATDEDQNLMVDYMRDKWLVWWGGNYDMGTLNFVSKGVDDLWIAFKIAYPQAMKYDLGTAVAYLGMNHLYEGLSKKDMQKKGFKRNAYLSQAQLRYAEADVEALELMWEDEKIRKVIDNNLAYRLAIYALREAMIWQQNGLPVLHDTVHKYTQETEAKIKEYMFRLKVLTGTDLNPRSSKQVKEYFGTSSSDKPTLTRIVINGSIDESHTSMTGRGIESEAMTFTTKQQEVAEAILDARKALNDMSKLKNYVFDTMVGRFSPVGAGTSRWTCKGGDLPNGFNAQNYPRQFKSCFGVKPDSGKIIVAADYATLEIRIACAIMGDQNMYEALMRGEDIHKSTASLVYDKPIDEVHGRERSNAKVANFGLTYGMGRDTFIQYAFDLYGIKFSEAEADELIRKFFQAYPGLKRYHNEVGKKLRAHNYICQTALGYRMKPKMYAEAINGPTQGTGGECMRLAIHIMTKKDARTLDVVVNSIHDAAYLIVPEVEKDYWAKLLKDSMQEAWYEIRKSKVFKYHDIPMPVDVMFGYNMGELEEDFAGGGQALSIAEMRETKERNAV